MATEFLRPDGDITTTNITGTFLLIDETSPSDVDFVFGTVDGDASTYEVSLTNLSGSYSSATVRYRIAKVDNGLLDGTGNAVTLTAFVYEGATLRATDSQRTATGTWTTYNWSPDLSAVSDWSDVRIRWEVDSNGGNPGNRRAGAISWAEIEVTTSSVHNLTATNLNSGTPSVGSPAITQTHVLTAANIASGVPGVGTPAVGQSHVLSANTVDSGIPTVGSPALTESHSLTANNLSAGQPTLGNPAIGQTHVLSANPVDTGQPTVGLPGIAQEHGLTASPIDAGQPTVGSPVAGESHVLTANGIDAGQPTIGLPAIGQVHAVTANNLDSGQPTTDTPSLGQSHAFSAPSELMAGQPLFASPALAEALRQCQEVDRETFCVYSAQICLPIAGNEETACTDFDWNPATNIWAIAMNACDCQTIVKRGDRFLAKKLIESFGPVGDKRQLWAFRIADKEQVQIVEVKPNGMEEPGTPVKPDDDCLWQGAVMRLTSGHIDGNACDPFVEDEDVYLVNIANTGIDADKQKTVKVGDRLFGRFLGKWSDDKCVFGIMPKKPETGQSHWAIAMSHWYKRIDPMNQSVHFMHAEKSLISDGLELVNADPPQTIYPNCNHIVVQVVDTCDQLVPNAEQPEGDPYWVKILGGERVGTFGLLVYLPTPNWQGELDNPSMPTKRELQQNSIAPNIEKDDILHIHQNDNGEWVSEGWGDGQIWENRVHMGKDIGLRQGWKKMADNVDDADRNIRANGGSGVSTGNTSMDDGYFIKEGFNLKDLAVSPRSVKDGGFKCLTQEMLEHSHPLWVTGDLPEIWVQCTGSIAAGTGLFALTREAQCTDQPTKRRIGSGELNPCDPPNKFPDFGIDPVEQTGADLPGNLGDPCSLTGDPELEGLQPQPQTGDVDVCMENWGPLPNEPPYRWGEWWERVDNSQSFRDAV